MDSNEMIKDKIIIPNSQEEKKTIIFERLNRLDYEPFDSKEHRPDKGS